VYVFVCVCVCVDGKDCRSIRETNTAIGSTRHARESESQVKIKVQTQTYWINPKGLVYRQTWQTITTESPMCTLGCTAAGTYRTHPYLHAS